MCPSLGWGGDAFQSVEGLRSLSPESSHTKDCFCKASAANPSPLSSQTKTLSRQWEAA